MTKKVGLLVLSICLVLAILSTTTYAVLYKQKELDNKENYTAGVLDIVLDNDEEGLGDVLNLANAIPLSDSDGKNTIPYKFKITNKGNISYTFSLKIISTTVSNAINSDYIKVMVDEEEPVTLSSLTNNIVKDNITLAPGSSVTISVRIWLSKNLPNTEKGKSFSAKIVTDGVGSEYQKPTTLDTSGANAPKLSEAMIPVMYNGSSWIKADSANLDEQYKWYDYNNKQWANAVLVSSSNRSTYLSADTGTEIAIDDILAFYVWIPRYKYKVFNISKSSGVDSYDAQLNGIDIVFEDGTAKTGTISCRYDFTITNGGPSEICSGTNGDYYTHPAFTFGDSELDGIWVGKFESIEGESIPNNEFPKTFSVDLGTMHIFFEEKQSFSYGGITSDKTVEDFHMIKNIEWGAIAYLTNSKYGRCNNKGCEEVSQNTYYKLVDDAYTGNEYSKTGCGPQSIQSRYAGGGTTENICNAYDTEIGMLASTTGNIYGIYDMSGGADEYAMANVSSTSGSYVYNEGEAGSDFSYSEAKLKYLDTYSNNVNPYRLGDATGEAAGWYDDFSTFPDSDFMWILRGGYCTDGVAGIFAYSNIEGYGLGVLSRAVLIKY